MPGEISKPQLAKPPPSRPEGWSGAVVCPGEGLLEHPGISRSMATRLRLWRLLFLCLLAACSRAPQGGPATDQFQQGTEAMERGDYAEAYCAWRPLAEQGDAQAQYNLGWFYANGYGVQVNPTKAVDWWQRAGEQGHIEAQFALGMMYASGDGMEPDLSQAIPWLLKAARQGHEDARDVLRKSLRENPEQLGEILPLLADQEWLGSQREVKGDKTNARAGPGTDHAVVTTLDKGARVQEIARSGSWVLVLLRQPLALVWIHSRLLQ